LVLSQDEQADFGLVQDEHSVLLLSQQLLQAAQLARVSEPAARARRRRLFMMAGWVGLQKILNRRILPYE
jgi:hypothetical protein